MFKVKHKITYENLSNNELADWLDEKFYLKGIHSNIWHETELMHKWGINFKKNMPSSLDELFFYIVHSLNSYHSGNYIGRVALTYVWPSFFEKFPNGQIWIIEISDKWWDTISSEEKKLAKSTKYKDKFPDGFFPQEATGLQTEHFPFFALNILSYGIYPIVLFHYIFVNSNLIFLYIPDRTFKYSQMNKGNQVFKYIFENISFVFDNREEFDPYDSQKEMADHILFNPIKLFSYYDWGIQKIEKRILDICNIKNNSKSFLLGMTVNRALYDTLLCILYDSPYISKVFFFNSLDKFANLMTLVSNKKDETTNWKKIVSTDFLKNEIIPFINNISNKIIGEYLLKIVEDTINKMDENNLSPDDLRIIRNSNHGYSLRENQITRLLEMTGEMDNNISMLIFPISLYFLSNEFKVNKEK